MAFPIYHCGQILFRNGRPAMSTDCCCIKVPCCSDCYFPVDNRSDVVPGLGAGLFQIGGPTQIQNFTFYYQGPSGYYNGLKQVGPSVHSIHLVPVDDCGDVLRYASRCEWFLQGKSITSDNPDGDPDDVASLTGIRLLYGGTENTDDSWKGSYYQFGVSIFPAPIDIANNLISPGSCSSASWNYEFAFGAFVNTNVGSFDVVTGKSWPSGFECRSGYLYNLARNRYAFESDLPDGFL